MIAAAGGRYAAIAALTNIPATIFAVLLYEVFLADSDRPLTPQALEHVRLAHGNRRLTHTEEGPTVDASHIEKGQGSSGDSGKASVEAYEVAPEVRLRE